MNMVLVHEEQVQAIRSALPAVTKVWLQEVLGVSETTWRSLRDGRPIRQSTYDRLLAKLERTRGLERSSSVSDAPRQGYRAPYS